MKRRRIFCAIALIGLLMPTAALSAEGKNVYKGTCWRCHEWGTGGAPKLGDAAAWKERLTKGKKTLYEHAIYGFKAMPAKGGNSNLSDEEVKAAVDYMAEQSE